MKLYPDNHLAKGSISSWLILLIELLLVGTFSYLVPIAAEDLIFTASHRSFLDGEDPLPNFSRLIPDFLETYSSVNGRLVDKLQIIVLLMPKWVQALFTALCYCSMQAGILMLSGLWSKRRATGLKLLSALILFAFTGWNENMFLISYVFNYFLTGAICIYFTLYFCSDRLIAKLKGGKLIVGLFIAFILGLWHEIITLTLAPALVAFALLSSRKLLAKRLIFYIPLFAGFILFLFLPGQQDRFSTVDMAIYSFNNILWGYTFIPRYHSVLFIAYPAVLFFYVIYHCVQLKGNLIRKFNALFPNRRRAILVMACISAIMVLYLQLRFASLRAAILGVMLISGAAPMLLIPHINKMSRCFRIFLLIIEGILISALLINWILSICQQYRLHKAYEDINKIWKINPKNQNAVFYDLPFEYSMSDSPFHPTTSSFTTQGWKLLIMREYRFPDRTDFNPFVVPTAMREPFDKTTQLIDPRLGLYRKEEHLFLHTPYNLSIENPAPGTPYYYLVNFKMKTKDGERGNYFSIIPFVPEKDASTTGWNFYYLQPMESYPYMLHLRDAEYDSLLETTAKILYKPLVED